MRLISRGCETEVGILEEAEFAWGYRKLIGFYVLSPEEEAGQLAGILRRLGFPNQDVQRFQHTKIEQTGGVFHENQTVGTEH